MKVDKTGWPDGVWMDEPDEVRFSVAGFECFIVRHHRLGHLCGYIGVPQEHPFYGVNYDDIDIEAHGGLTYSDEGSGLGKKVEQFEVNEQLWFLGFDCAHFNDHIPTLEDSFGSEYRTIEYVKKELARIATQLEVKHE